MKVIAVIQKKRNVEKLKMTITGQIRGRLVN
jgi:hypothetical protein